MLALCSRFRQSQIRVRLGEYDFENEGETESSTYDLASMKMHEQYDPQTFENDIAILTLDRNVIFSKSVQAACLPDSDFDYTGTRGTVTGWGTIYFGGPSSNILQEVTIPIWTNSECATNYGKLDRKIESTMMCAGNRDFGGQDACQGDSGGPLNCPLQNNVPGLPQYELCGIVSWGARCAEKGNKILIFKKCINSKNIFCRFSWCVYPSDKIFGLD